ncbi:hypothetical protein CEXT_58621 [Caerostris extrusa]|uniref:Uncharacterized protein n=1 Tax=Caerostris extrusa TaxID=172846 RepID=A0AAV4W2Z7_CAEEX|nr:hypothetical protein CEXT_58621 [Caerostris extrusa]
MTLTTKIKNKNNEKESRKRNKYESIQKYRQASARKELNRLENRPKKKSLYLASLWALKTDKSSYKEGVCGLAEERKESNSIECGDSNSERRVSFLLIHALVRGHLH